MALDVLGDRWTLLVIRDLMLKGKSTFREFLDGGEGVASNVLTDRLSRLDKEGVIEKRRNPQDGRRFTYVLTEKGIALAPVLIDLIIWSATHQETNTPPASAIAMEQGRAALLDQIRQGWAEMRQPSLADTSA